MNDILVPTAPGELIDKLTILRLKSEKITDAAKLVNVSLGPRRLRDERRKSPFEKGNQSAFGLSYRGREILYRVWS